MTRTQHVSILAFFALAAVALPHGGFAQSRGNTSASVPPAAHTPTTVTGTISHYILSPTGRVRGLVLNGNTVAFLHGAGARGLPARAAPGTTVQVEGYVVAGQRATIHRATVRDADGHVLFSTPTPIATHATPRLTASARARRDRARTARLQHLEQLPTMTVSGTVQTILSNARGDVHGVLLADGTTVAVMGRLGREISRARPSRGTDLARGRSRRQLPERPVSAGRRSHIRGRRHASLAGAARLASEVELRGVDD